MYSHRNWLAFSLLALAAMALTAPATASDCSNPTNPVSRAECATPGARRANDALGEALTWSGRADLMSSAKRDLFIADQGAWLARRELTARTITPAEAEAGMRRRADQVSSCYPEPDETKAKRLGVTCIAYVAPKCPSVYLEVEPRLLHLPTTLAPSLATLSIDAAMPACQRMNVPVATKPRHSVTMEVTGERRGVFFTRTFEVRGSSTSTSPDAWDASTGKSVPWNAVMPGLATGTPAWTKLFSASTGKVEDVDGDMLDLRSTGVDLTKPPESWHVSSGGDLMLDYARTFSGGRDYVSVEVPKPLFIGHVARTWVHIFVPRG